MGLREPRLLVGGHGLTFGAWRTTATTLGVVAVAILVAVGAEFPGYRSSAEFHAAMEIFGALIGMLAGFAFLARFLANGRRIDLFAGMAFTVNAAEDIAHGLLPLSVARGWIEIAATDLERFIPATYATGRFLMAAILALGVLFARQLGWTETPAREARLVGFATVLVAVTLTTAAFFWQVPSDVVQDAVITRPADLVSAVLFGAVAVRLATRDLNLGAQGWLTAAAIVGGLGQTVIALSGELFDARFDLGHVAKVAMYVLPVVGFIRNQITVLSREQETVEELRRTDAARTAFLGSVTHELRTPLAAIQGFAAILGRDPEPAAELRRNMVGRIGRNASALNTLVEDILAFSRLEADSLEVSRETVELRRIARDVVERLQPLLADHTVKLAMADVAVIGDPRALGQVFTNLVTNASYYTPKGSTIRLVAVPLADRVRVVCEDDGPGLDPAEHDHVFDRFHRGVRGSNSSRPGTGIGLNVVRELVEAMGGSIAADRSSDLGGARFIIDLPRAT